MGAFSAKRQNVLTEDEMTSSITSLAARPRAIQREIPMKNFKVAALAASFALISVGGAHAATDSSSASAEIVAAIAITNTVGLNFGQIAPSALAGTVSVSTANVRQGLGGVTLGNAGTVSASSFDVTGAPNNTYTITLPANGVVELTSGFAFAPMAVDDFVSDPDTTGLLNGAGAQTLLVGATLSVGANQPSDIYSGTFDVTVTYE
jgi:hypothetical protein